MTPTAVLEETPVIQRPTDQNVLRLEQSWSEGLPVIACHGDVEKHTAHKIKYSVEDLIADGHNQVIVDLRSTNYIDSAGLGTFVLALKQLIDLNGNLYLVLSDTDTPVDKALRITGLADKLFPHGESIERAVSYLKEYPTHPNKILAEYVQ